MNAAQDQHYRCAIALNNIGVQLLQRSSFKQAVQVLKDAVYTIRIAFPTKSSASNTSHNPAACDTERLIADATKKLYNPLSSNPKTVDVCSWDLQRIDVLNIERMINQVLSASTINLVPVTIDMIDIELEERSADFQAALILYNFALAHVGLASRPQECARTEFLKGALRMLQLSHAIVMEDAATDFSISSLTLTALILSTTGFILSQIGNDDDVRYTLLRLETVVRAIQEEQEYIELQDSSVSPAAAAA
jgi:hypothetical protein